MKSPTSKILAGIFLAISHAAVAADAPPSQGEFLFRNKVDGYNTFRIPAVTYTPKGTLLAFCEGRFSPGDAGNIDIVLRRSTDGGKTWSPLQVVWDEGYSSCSNPCPVVVSKTGEIILLAVRKPATIFEKELLGGGPRPADRCRPFILRSIDDGKTWSKPEEITESVDRPEWMWYVTGPGNGIELHHGPHAGRLVIPANHGEFSNGAVLYDAHSIYSDDQGKTWHLSYSNVSPGANESTIAELNNGTLLFNTRMQANGVGKRGEATSSDGGKTWVNFKADTNLTCPGCEGSLMSVEFTEGNSKDLHTALLFSNPQGQGGGRKDLTVQLSADGGKTWPRKMLIQAGPTCGYSSLTRFSAGGFGVLYEGVPNPSGGILWKNFSIKDLTASH